MPTTDGDVTIEVTGNTDPDMQAFANSDLDVGILSPTGVSIHYGLNSIPYAALDLTPEDLDLVCDIELWRRAPVDIRIESKLGCLSFRGLIDGLSMSQSVGDMRMQLIVKSPFQVLHEINPRLLGYHASGVEFTKRVEALSQYKGKTGFNALKLNVGAEIKPEDLAKPLFDGMIAVLNAVVDSQVSWALTAAKAGSSAGAAIEAAKAIANTHLKAAKLLLAKIDTKFVPTNLTLADYFTANWVLEAICETRSNMFDLLLSLLEVVGCGLVIGNDRAFIVPNSGFLKQTHKSEIKFREFSTEPNILLPSQYNSVSFSDHGYKDISGVYIQADDHNSTTIDGFFQDTEHGGKGGIIGETMPYIISFNNASLRAASYNELSAALGNDKRGHTPQDLQGATAIREADQLDRLKGSAIRDGADAMEVQRKADLVETAALKAMTKLANEWAELRYYQLKYTDRQGGVTMMFNPNTVPGTVGSVYLREPGVYIDFFATSVSHEIRLNAPDGGTAITSLGFNCGRMGAIASAPISAGLAEFTLFDGFDAARSAKVAKEFVKDTQ